MEIAKVNNEAEDETVPVEQVKCLVLKDDVEAENEESSEGKDEEEREILTGIFECNFEIFLLIIGNYRCCQARQQSCRKEEQVEGGGERVCSGQGCLKI